MVGVAPQGEITPHAPGTPAYKAKTPWVNHTGNRQQVTIVLAPGFNPFLFSVVRGVDDEPIVETMSLTRVMEELGGLEHIVHLPRGGEDTRTDEERLAELFTSMTSVTVTPQSNVSFFRFGPRIWPIVGDKASTDEFNRRLLVN